MKKFTTIALVFAFCIALAPSVFANTKPQATWQVYSSVNDLLIVHTGNANSMIYFAGKAENYDGTAVYPNAPTSEYITKTKDLKRAEKLENQGMIEQAEAIRAKY